MYILMIIWCQYLLLLEVKTVTNSHSSTIGPRSGHDVPQVAGLGSTPAVGIIFGPCNHLLYTEFSVSGPVSCACDMHIYIIEMHRNVSKCIDAIEMHPVNISRCIEMHRCASMCTFRYIEMHRYASLCIAMHRYASECIDMR